ncbi:MAG: hypothetical protein J6S67_23285 [Methanobrevibacter sp.]|nr:hypothetical protein [Methanobrevibacter sp.]
MNDRFKCRVWDTDIKEYLVGEFLVGGCGDMIHNVVDYESFLNKGNYIVEQCTGLKDKNGNLIYEGDIVNCDRDFCGEGRVGLIRTVVFSDGAFQIQKINKEDRYYINAFHNIEIIGNIHEQAEQKDK